MPRLINESGVLDDDWIIVSDDQQVIPGSKVILSLYRLHHQVNELQSTPVGLGLEIAPDDPVEGILKFLNILELIILRFDNFADGRAFSQARLLRDRYGFEGDIRAIGDVVCEQLAFMKRCGFNQYLLDKDAELDWAFKSFSEISSNYQRDSLNDGRPCRN